MTVEVTVEVHSGSQLAHVWLTEVGGSDDFEDSDGCLFFHNSLVVGRDHSNDEVCHANHSLPELVGSEDFAEPNVDHAPQPNSVELVEKLVLVAIVGVLEAVVVEVSLLVVVVLQS